MLLDEGDHMDDMMDWNANWGRMFMNNGLFLIIFFFIIIIVIILYLLNRPSTRASSRSIHRQQNPISNYNERSIEQKGQKTPIPIYCTNCGYQVKDPTSSKYCPECGTPIY